MGKFLEKCNLPKLNEEEAESLNRPITAGKIEAVIKKLLAHKSPRPDSFTGEFYKTFEEDLTPILHRLFQKNPRENSPNNFHEASIILIPKPEKDTTKKENFRPILLMKIDAKSLIKYRQTTSSKKITHHDQVAFIQGCNDGTIFANQ